MKRIVYGLLMIVLVAGLCLSCGPALTPTGEPIVLKATTFLPRDNTTFVYNYWENLVNERGKGELIIEYAGGPETIPTLEQHLAVRDGIVDICISPPMYYGALMPEAIATVATQLNYEEERKGEVYKIMQERHHAIGLHFLGQPCSWQTISVWTNSRVEKPQEDFKGVRYSTRGAYNPFMIALGCSPVEVAMPETYSALERGVAEGVIFPNISFYDMKLYEVTKYCIEPAVYRGWLALIINLDTWNALPKHVQDLLTQASLDMEEYAWDYGHKLMAEQRKVMEDYGMEYIGFSSGDAKWYAALAYNAMWDQAIEREPVWGAKLKDAMTKK